MHQYFCSTLCCGGNINQEKITHLFNLEFYPRWVGLLTWWSETLHKSLQKVLTKLDSVVKNIISRHLESNKSIPNVEKHVLEEKY